MPNGKNNQKNRPQAAGPQRPSSARPAPPRPAQPLPRPIPRKWDPNAAKGAPPQKATPALPAAAAPPTPTPTPPPPLPTPPPAAVPLEETEEILIKDANGKFKVLRRGELEEVAIKTSREVIDRIQKEIMEALEKKPPVAGTVAPATEVFDQEEEAKGVEKIVPKLAAPAKAISELDLPKYAEQVVKQSAISLKDPVLLNRLKTIIITQLRGVRKMLDTRLILIRPTQLGGMSLDGSTADKIIEAISKILEPFEKKEKREKIVSLKAKEEFSKIKSTFVEPGTVIAQPVPQRLPRPLPPRPVAPPPPTPPPPPPAPPSSAVAGKWPSFVQTTVKPAPPPQPSIKPQAPWAPSAQLPPPAPSAPPVPLAPPAPPAPEMPEKAALEIPVKDFTPKAAIRPPESGKITDIRAPFKLVGPVQELSYSLIDFRRLADSPHRAILKIEEKLKNLEAESFSQKIQGINAWQSSEVFQTYLSMGLQALNQKISLDDVIKQRQMANRGVLTKEEFEVVNELNQRLQF